MDEIFDGRFIVLKLKHPSKQLFPRDEILVGRFIVLKFEHELKQ